MKLSIALKEALRYNMIAAVPTLLGLGIAGVALWTGALQPILEVVAAQGPGGVVSGSFANSPGFSPLVAVAGVTVGYLVHRVGRTTVLFKIQGDAVAETLDAVGKPPADGAVTPADGSESALDDGTPAETPPERSADGPARSSDATDGPRDPSKGV